MSTEPQRHPEFLTQYVLVEVFQYGIGDYRVICQGNDSRELFQDVADVAAPAFSQICEQYWDRINENFDFQAYLETFDNEPNGLKGDLTYSYLIELLPRLLSTKFDALTMDVTESIWGDWSELIRWVTDDLPNGDGILFSIEGGIPNFPYKLLEWEQDSWDADSHVPGWWCDLRDLLKNRRWWIDERDIMHFNSIIQLFNKQHTL